MDFIFKIIKQIPTEHIAVAALLIVIYWLFKMVKDRDESLKENTKILEKVVTLVEILVFRKGSK